MKIYLIDQIEDVMAIERQWSELLSQTRHANFFQTVAWLKAYWTHYGAGQDLRIVVLEDAGSLVGILPFVVRTESTKVGPVRFLTYPLDYWGSFYGPIGQNSADILRHGLRYMLSHHTGDWDLVELRWIGTVAGERDETASTLAELGMTPICTEFDQTAVIDLSSSWEDYIDQRSSKWRNNMRRMGRRLSEVGEVRYERFRATGSDTDPMWDVFESCMDIAAHSWQATSRNGTTICHEKIKSFIVDCHRVAAEAGGYDMNLLYVDNQPVAFAYNYHYRGYISGLRVGRLPDFNRFGVGNILYVKAIEDSFDRGDWRYDLGPGSIEIKRHLLTDVLPNYRLSCFDKKSVRHKLLRWRRLQQSAAQGLDGAMPQFTATKA